MDGREREEVPQTSFKSRGPYIALLLVGLALAGVAGGVWWWKTQQPDEVVAVPDAGAPPAPVVDAGAEAAGPDVDVAQGNAKAKATLEDLVPKSWLEGGDVVRRIAAAVNAVAEGESPKTVLPFLSPEGIFIVETKTTKTFISAKNDARYDAVTEAIGKLDAKAAADVYRQLAPFLEKAYAEIARPGSHFEPALRKAIDRLVSTPIADGPREVIPLDQGTGYTWADPKVEALSPAQKHLLRMGPKNARVIVKQLKAFRDAL